jgi:hypothetical protein
MGDRASIAIISGEGQEVWLYSHWGGSRVMWTLARTLEVSGRHDADYLTRILQARMVADGYAEGVTGDGAWVRGFDMIRWDDSGYGDPVPAADTDPELLRALLGTMAGQLSHGISSTYMDSEYPLVAVIATPGGTIEPLVAFADRPDGDDGIRWTGHIAASEFVARCQAVRASGAAPHALWRMAEAALAQEVTA